MAYSVKEIFKTLQGEGGQAGRVAVFCRFAGCNLWSGREEDRADAACDFCDTDFVGTDGEGGGKFADAPALARRLGEIWGEGREGRCVVFTGGEPLLQLDAGADRRGQKGRVFHRGGKQWHVRAAAGDSTGFASVPRREPNCGRARGRS